MQRDEAKRYAWNIFWDIRPRHFLIKIRNTCPANKFCTSKYILIVLYIKTIIFDDKIVAKRVMFFDEAIKS